MTQIEAQTNAIAAFFKALSYYPTEIISLTYNGVTYQLDMNISRDRFNIEFVLEDLNNVILSKAVSKIIRIPGRDYDILYATWEYE